MTEVHRLALVTSHMMDLRDKNEELAATLDLERHHFQSKVEDLEAMLWKAKAAYEDAEREVTFVKTTAIRAIRKLGCAIRERDEARAQAEKYKTQRDDVNANCLSLQTRLIKMAAHRNHHNRTLNAGAAPPPPPSPFSLPPASRTSRFQSTGTETASSSDEEEEKGEEKERGESDASTWTVV